MHRLRLVALPLALLIACSETTSTTVDAASGVDATASDSGQARPDAGTPGADAALLDLGVVDGATAPDSGAPEVDGGAPEGDSGSPEIDGGSASPDTGIMPPRRDVVRPTVTVNQASSQADPTPAGPILYDVVFSEPMDVASVEGADFTIAPADGVSATVQDQGDHRRFTLRVIVPERLSNYQVSLAEGRAQDPAGNLNEASTHQDAQVTVQPTLPTVTIQRLNPTPSPVLNTLPIAYFVQFSAAMDPATITVSDFQNDGTAQGITWTLTPNNPGGSYTLSATAITTPGTLIPVLPRAAAQAIPSGADNRRSVYVGPVLTYTPLPILRITDSSAQEGDELRFSLSITGPPPPSLHFDWTTRDGTAIAGPDYVTSGANNVAFAGTFMQLRVPATTEDEVPEGNETFELVLSNVQGAVYVESLSATGTIINDDRGATLLGGNDGFFAEPRVTDLALFGDDVLMYGTSAQQDATLSKANRSTGVPSSYLSVGQGQLAAGMGVNALGAYVGVDNGVGGFIVQKLDDTATNLDSAFGDFGMVTVLADAAQSYGIADITVRSSRVFVVGSRTSSAGSAWYIEARDSADGTLTSTFASGGRLIIDHRAGPELEQARSLATIGAAMFVLGRVGDRWSIEKRDTLRGALVPDFAQGGVKELDFIQGEAALVLYDDQLYVAGGRSVGSVVARIDAATGAVGWAYTSPMDAPGAISAGSSGVFVGGTRDQAWHVEHYELDGTPVWSHTTRRDRAPAGAYAVLLDGDWVYFAGTYHYSRYQDWVLERRWIADGYAHLENPGEPPR